MKACFLGQAKITDHTFSKVNPKYLQHSSPVVQARYSFHLPFSYNLQILLARGNGASTNVKPCDDNDDANEHETIADDDDDGDDDAYKCR